MQNALAVYSSKPSFNARKLAAIAHERGAQLRFMALGGYLFGNVDEMQNKALAAVNGGAVLVVGALEAEAATLAEFDRLVGLGDRRTIATILNGGTLPWCELYVGRFNYKTMVDKGSNARTEIDGSVPRTQLPALKASKTRYIIYNQSRRKHCGKLMTWLAELLAGASEGIVADFKRPPR